MSLYKIEEKFVSTSKDIIHLINSYLEVCHYCKKHCPIIHHFKTLPLTQLCNSCWKTKYCHTLFKQKFSLLENHINGLSYMYHSWMYTEFYTTWIKKYLVDLKHLFKEMNKQYPHPMYLTITLSQLKQINKNIVTQSHDKRLSLIKHIFNIWNVYMSFLS